MAHHDERNLMHVEFWFDPACPFCWMTSRWLVEVSTERDLDIEWKPISLLFKNGTAPDSPFYERVRFTTDLLRVVESVRAGGQGATIQALYTEFGRRIHMQGIPIFDADEVRAILTEVGADPSHADALTDESFDAVIRAGMAEGLALVGDDVGTPIIAITGRSGRVGLFGPVITELPAPEDRLRLWDGFLAMVDTPGFFELKRTRRSAPDMQTIHFD
jgi:2-hydroxychromene-2-carboxylate isomerase